MKKIFITIIIIISVFFSIGCTTSDQSAEQLEQDQSIDVSGDSLEVAAAEYDGFVSAPEDLYEDNANDKSSAPVVEYVYEEHVGEVNDKSNVPLGGPVTHEFDWVRYDASAVSGIALDSMEGWRLDDSADDLYRLDIYSSLRGNVSVDLNKTIITITDGTTTNNLHYIDGVLKSPEMTTVRADGFYIVEVIRDDDGSFTKSNPVMNTGDLIKIIIFTIPTNEMMGDSSLAVIPSSTIGIDIVSEGVPNTRIGLYPPSFWKQLHINLYPQ